MTTKETTIGIVTSNFQPPEKVAESYGHRMVNHASSDRTTQQTPSWEREKRAKVEAPRKVKPSSRKQNTHQAAPQDKATERAQTQKA
jgi:hypothetical protein